MRALLAAVLALLLFGCSGDEPGHLQTEDVRLAAAEAGFERLRVHSNEEAVSEAAERLGHPAPADGAADFDIVYLGSFLPDSSLAAIRLPSTEAAQERMRYTLDTIDDEELAMLREEFPGLDPQRVREIRVCNVVISSYDDGSDPRLPDRLDRMIELLHERCDD